MRYDTPVFFQKRKAGGYNPKTGDYDDATVEETAVMAAVVSTRIDTLKQIYGKMVEGSYTVHVQNKLNDKFDAIRIGDTVYTVDYTRTLRVKQAFVISEDKNAKDNVGG